MSGYARRSARVLVLDAQDRLLLVCLARDPSRPERGDVWITPGGGVERGESLTAAAVRELREETGLVAEPAALHHAAWTEAHADLGWIRGRLRDDFFVCRVASHQVDTAGHTDYERRAYRGHRWWTGAELAAPDGEIVPASLSAFVLGLLAGPLPAAPVELAWRPPPG